MSTSSPAELALAPASTADNDQFVYRLLTRPEWSTALAQQRYLPTPLDQRDGYIHLSTLSQALTTARLFFPHASDLLLLQLNAASLWPQLRWEAVEARGGERFPHYYQPHIPLSCVTQITELCQDSHTNQHSLSPHLAHSAFLTPQLALASPLPPLYKIASTSAYLAAQSTGHYTGNDKDVADGFIHLATLDQLDWVALKFTATTDELLLLTLYVDRAVDGYRLLWEAAKSLRDKPCDFVNLFCHIYPAGKEQLSIDVRRCVARVDKLHRAANGTIILPSDLRTRHIADAQ